MAVSSPTCVWNGIVFIARGQVVSAIYVKTGSLVRTFEGHTSTVEVVMTHGGLLYTGSKDKTSRIWNIKNGQLLRVLHGNSKRVVGLALVGDDLFTGAKDGRLLHYPNVNNDDGVTEGVRFGNERSITKMGHLGSYVLVWNDELHRLTVYDTRKELHKAAIELSSLKGDVFGFEVFQDLLYVGMDEYCCAINIEMDEIVFKCPAKCAAEMFLLRNRLFLLGRSYLCAYSVNNARKPELIFDIVRKDGGSALITVLGERVYIVPAKKNRSLTVHDAQSGKQVDQQELKAAADSVIGCRTTVFVSFSNFKIGVYIQRDILSLLNTVEGHAKRVTSFHATSDTLYTNATDMSRVRAWPLNGKTLPRRFVTEDEVEGLLVDRGLLFAATKKGVQSFDLETGKAMASYEAPRATLVTMWKDILVVGCIDTVHTFSLKGKLLQTIDFPSMDDVGGRKTELTALLVSGGRVFAGAYNGYLLVANIKTGSVIHMLHVHRSGVLGLAVDGNTVYTGGRDHKITAYAIKSGKLLWEVLPTHAEAHDNRISSLIFLNNMVISGSYDGDVKLWDSKGGKYMGLLTHHNDRVTSMAVGVGKNPKLFVASNRLTVHNLWVHLSLRTKMETTILTPEMVNGKEDRDAAEKTVAKAQYYQPLADLILRIFLIVLDALQLASFAVQPEVDWESRAVQDTIEAARSFGLTVAYLTSFVSAAILVFVFLAIFSLQEWLEWKQYLAAWRTPWKFTWLGVNFYCRMLSGPLFIGVLSALASSLDCRSVDGAYVHDLDKEMVCWEGAHIAYSVISVFFGFFFVMFSVRLTIGGKQLGNVDLQWNIFNWGGDGGAVDFFHPLVPTTPWIDVLVLACKSVFTLIAMYATRYPALISAVELVLCIGLTVCSVLRPPYSSTTASSLRTSLYAATQWCLWVGLFVYVGMDPVHATWLVPAGALLFGFAVFALSRWLSNKRNPPPKDEEEPELTTEELTNLSGDYHLESYEVSENASEEEDEEVGVGETKGEGARSTEDDEGSGSGGSGARSTEDDEGSGSGGSGARSTEDDEGSGSAGSGDGGSESGGGGGSGNGASGSGSGSE